jgi:uroporphyrinogen-III decarboxylase
MTDNKKWADLSPDEKREERFKKWLSPPSVQFINSEAEKNYKARVTRFIKVIKLEEPDRVPVMLPASFFAAGYAGTTLKNVMYDYKELKRAWVKFFHDFDMDSFTPPGLVYPGKVLDAIDYKLQYWPGHGLADDISCYQFIEGEYMKADEYDEFVNDQSNFMLTKYLPSVVGEFGGFRKLGSMLNILGGPFTFISLFNDPEFRKSIQTALHAAEEISKWQSVVSEIRKESMEAGFPSVRGAMCSAPYDLIGDSLRGTKGIMMDMYKRPEKLHEAMEKVTPMIIERAVKGADASGCPIVFIPLHKGADGFMSNKQYETFYWPGYKKVLMGLIDNGLVPLSFAEGSYMQRLDIIKDLPKGKVIWYFESMDMAKAKKELGDISCIAGNLPVSILCTGTPQQVKEGCRKLIEACAEGGGYILTASASIDQGSADNMRAMMDAAKEYGVYKK